MVLRLRIDSYEAGTGAVGGLATFHNSLYPCLSTRGFEIKTFSMRFREDLPSREDFRGIIVRRPAVDVDLDTAYAWTYDILHQYGINVDYLTTGEINAVLRYFTNFATAPTPFRMSRADLFSPHDWMSYLRSALIAWLHPDLVQAVFLHSTEPGRSGGVWHRNLRGTSDKLELNDFSLRRDGGFENSFFGGLRLIRDLEFSLTYKILERQPYSALFAVSKIHRNEYLFGLRAHGAKWGKVQNRIFAIYHGVDTKLYRPLNNAEKNGFRIGFIGRCDPVKGIDIVPHIASILKEKIPEIKFHVVTKAETTNSYYQGLLKEIYDRKLGDLIKIDNTFYSGEEKIKLFNSWDILLCPSKYEPQGQIDLEAMACGVIPAVGLGGLREKIADGFNGVWINPYNAEEAAGKIYKLYKGEYGGRKTAEIRENARESTEKIWDWERRADVHKEIYTYLTDGRVDNIKGDLEDLLLPSPILD